MYDLKRIYDAHVHYRPISDSFDENIQNIQDFLGFSTIAGINILLLRERLNTLGDDAPCLYAKALYPEKVSVFNGLAIGYSTIPVDSEGLVNQVKELIEAGFDGFKMISTLSTKETWGFEIDDDRCDAMFSLLEETQFPITWHVGNTEHWPVQRGPGSDFLLKNPYKPGNEPDNEPLYGRLEHVLEKHPKLNLMIPHWLFMSEHFDRLDNFMQRHPNVTIDITPGSAMLHYMGLEREKWHDFVVRYQDRIVFGTDNFLFIMHGALDQYTIVRRFLETGDTFFTPFVPTHSYGFEITGIGPFSDKILQKIYWDNFDRIRGGVRPLDLPKAIAFLEKELEQMEPLSTEQVSERNRSITRKAIARLKAML